MSKYSNEFFREYESIYSDTEPKNEHQYEEERINSKTALDRDQYNRSGSNSGRNSAYRNSRSKNPRDSAKRPAANRRQYRIPRTARRALILTVGILIVAALISAIIVIASLVSGPGDVSNLQVSDIAAHQVALIWEKADKAEGYRVEIAKGDSGEYEEYQTISDPDTLSVTVSELEQASLYSFSVTAFRGKAESKAETLENIRTLPDAPEITYIASAKKGAIHLEWSENDTASGYVVEYKKDGGDYSPDLILRVSDPVQHTADITNLEAGTTYTARIYTYLTSNEQLNSAPSAEASVKVAAEDGELIPHAMAQQADSSIDPDKPMIALTFDDGPSVDGNSSDRILDVLEKYNAKATFFMLGCNAEREPENVKRKADLKMEIGNHTWDHFHIGEEVTPDDIRKASNMIHDINGRYPTCFRSPGGMTTDTILAECAAEGISVYYWSIDSEDWSSRNADAVYHAVMDNVRDGDIILMHEIYDSTAEAVERMVPELIEQGYQLVTCHDLIALKTGSDPVAGKQYVNAFS